MCLDDSDVRSNSTAENPGEAVDNMGRRAGWNTNSRDARRWPFEKKKTAYSPPSKSVVCKQ